MKSKRPKPAPQKKGTVLRPYSLADFILEMRSPMELIDIVSRVHYLTGFDKNALILLREVICNQIGHDLSAKLLKMEYPEYFDQKNTSIGNVLSYLDSKIGGTTWVFGEHNENKLTLDQIAIICIFNGRAVPKKNAKEIAQEYGHDSMALYNNHCNHLKVDHAKWIREDEKNKKEFIEIRPYLNVKGLAKWDDIIKVSQMIK